MSKPCTVCDHPQLEAINTALEAKTSVREVGGQFEVSKSAVDRHKRSCLPTIKTRTRKLQGVQRRTPGSTQQSPFIRRVDDHTAKMEMLRDEAIKNGDDRTAVMVAREVKNGLELFGRATGELADKSQPAQQGPLFMLAPGVQVNVHIGKPPAQRAVETGEVIEIEPTQDVPKQLNEGESDGQES
jgi:hypothetical protein